VINRGFDHQLVELRTQQGRELIGYVVLGRRTLHRSRENHEFWKWVYHYRRNSLPIITRAITTRAKHADVHVSSQTGCHRLNFNVIAMS